jgi:hypothetical protein
MTNTSSGRGSNWIERAIGRSLAIWTHPVGAWRRPSWRVRLVLVVGYVLAGYVGVLSTLLVTSS